MNEIHPVDMDGLIGTIIIMELKENVGVSTQILMVYISKQKMERDFLMEHGVVHFQIEE